jgi:hypothetical protein
MLANEREKSLTLCAGNVMWGSAFFCVLKYIMRKQYSELVRTALVNGVALCKCVFSVRTTASIILFRVQLKFRMLHVFLVTSYKSKTLSACVADLRDLDNDFCTIDS